MIDRLYEAFPELYREMKAGISKFRMITGFLSITALSYLIYAMNFEISHPDLTSTGATLSYLKTAGGFQIFVLAFFGLSEAIRSIVDEKTQKTWDFQRLTPLGSWRLVIGKALASSLFPLFLYACFLPGEIFVLFRNPEAISVFLSVQLQYLATAFAIISIGVLISSHSEKTQRGTIFLVFVAAYLIFSSVFSGANASGETPVMRFLFWEISTRRWFTMTSLIAGIWALLGAKWRVGEDLLEGRRFWRLPAFIVFLYFYATAVSFQNRFGVFETTFLPQQAWTADVIPVLVYLFCLVDPAPRSRVRLAFDTKRPLFERLNSLPLWVLSCAGVFLSTVIIYMINGIRDPSSASIFGHLMGLVPFFLLRDCLIFQALAWIRVRAVSNLAVIVTCLLYVLPGLFLKLAMSFAVDTDRLIPIFLPVIPEGVSVFYAVLPVLFQIAFLSFLLIQLFGKLPAPHSAKEI